MALRHPPKNVVPPAARVRRRAPRVVRFEEPPEGFWRRWRRRLIRPATVVPRRPALPRRPSGVLGYYYTVFSAAHRPPAPRRGLHAQRRASTPRRSSCASGENMSAEDLVAWLKRAGYVEKAQQADTARGRYQLDGRERRNRAEQGLAHRRPAAVPARARPVRQGRQVGRRRSRPRRAAARSSRARGLSRS